MASKIVAAKIPNFLDRSDIDIFIWFEFFIGFEF
jgi:hypothetical protein